MNKAAIFLEKYKLLEEVVRCAYRLKNEASISHYLCGQNKYKRYADEIRYCQEVRNLLSHKKKLDDTFAVEPSDSMLSFIDRLTKEIQSRPLCSDIQVRLKQVCHRTLDDSVKEAMAIMRRDSFTHIPLLNKKGQVIGVFDENSIFTYIATEGIVSIDDRLAFRDIAPYTALEREMEAFVFVKPSTYAEELEATFEGAFNNGRRIELAFVTPNGSPHEPLQGIITPWDLIDASADFN